MLRLFWVFAVVVAAAAGCGPGTGTAGPKLVPVRGSVLLADGTPMAGATVTLHPTGGPAPSVKPFGVVGADGTYTLGVSRAGEGAPPGPYAVTVVWRAVDPAADTPPDKLKGKYADPARPVATVTVADGDNALEPFRLK